MASSIPALKNVVEPAFIVFAFTIGTLINRRRPEYDDDVDACERGSEDSSSRPTSPLLKPGMRVEAAEESRVNSNLIVRFYRTFPFLSEIWYWNLTYCILHFERFFGFDIELGVQQYVLNSVPWLMPILAKVYYSHISLGICFIIYTYSFLPPSTFQRIRRTIAMDNVVAFFIVTSWRCMPPRLLPAEYGFIDILHSAQGGGNAWTHNKFQLTIAAMPSLHCGTALFLAWSICRFSPHRPLRLIAPLWPMAMFLTIVATANHFVLDAMVGAMVPVIGWRYNHVILYLKPMQDKVLEGLGLKVPDDERLAPIPKEW
ncbi:hypothetical protein K4K49_010056 [Colletotrichum sp. SAR 10_70]|nr:hypothetical protein K4K50_009258 [Colletotrichum sp. SAR 10_71]KAI8194152.1 hypothetical protein K4K49_010056 [Colletotrichum sp. SAR 10_70]KAI8228749.1 hypothetical protein K4K54_001969 [Colletotrichum sp. SAR 10_86]